MALADEFDGVVWVGGEPIPGAADALTALFGAGKEIVFVTNNPGRPAVAYAERLREMGDAVAEDRVLTAGAATAGLAAERVGAGRTAFTIGADAFREEAAQ